MKTKLRQVLDRCLNGREVAIWGNPTRPLLRELKEYKFHISENVDPSKHYVVAVNEEDMDDFFADEQSKAFEYNNDCFAFDDHGGNLPFEWECHGVKIGRQTYFGERFVEGCKYRLIESIGHFTSINKTAMIQSDHQQKMLFTSDDLPEFFTDESMALYESKKLAEPIFPWNGTKSRVTIGNDAYIGAYAFINASKVTNIGDGAIIGAGAVVLEDVPPYAVVVGVPAKIKKYRFPPEMIEALLRIKWWNWPVEKINENADALMSPEIFMDRFGGR